MMDKLRQKLEDVSGRLTLINADATNLPFEDDSFDCALTAHVLHLIADWQQALAEIRRVLKPEGTYLYFHSPSGSVIPNKFEEQWEAILAQYNFHSSKRGATNEEVLQWLSEQAAELETVTVAQFQRVQTVAELLQKYRDRIYSHFWQIPEDIFSLAIRDLEAWTYRYYESEDISIPSEFKIEITAMRS